MIDLPSLMLLMIQREVPAFRNPSIVETVRSEKIEPADTIDQLVGTGALVSPDVDRVLLAAARWYEARFANRPPDGDCGWFLRPKGWQHEGGHGGTCRAKGPMQVGLGWSNGLLPTDLSAAGLPDPIPRDFDPHDPEAGVRAGYAVLVHWKTVCGASHPTLPGVWLTAYGWGRCPPRLHTGLYIDREGVRRCALATSMLEATGTKPDGWRCGHEGRKLEPYDARFIAWVGTQGA